MHLHTTEQEENILLKRQNEELSAKLKQLGGILTRTKEELARYRVSNGRDPHELIEEEELMRKKLDVCLLSFYFSNSYGRRKKKGVTTDGTDKPSNCEQESERDRSQLAENLSSLCSSILKVVYLNTDSVDSQG